jgi:hypothetical protein
MLIELSRIELLMMNVQVLYNFLQGKQTLLAGILFKEDAVHNAGLGFEQSFNGSKTADGLLWLIVILGILRCRSPAWLGFWSAGAWCGVLTTKLRLMLECGVKA